MSDQPELSFFDDQLVCLPKRLLNGYSLLGLKSDDLAVLLQIIAAAQAGRFFVAPKQLAELTGLSENIIYQKIQLLLNQGFMKLATQSSGGRQSDRYDLRPLWKKLDELNQTGHTDTLAHDQGIQITNVQRQIEVEFGRTLSPLEAQTIAAWITHDHYESATITLALREAVLNDARSLKYMDRILINWERRGIKTQNDLQHYRDGRLSDF